MKKKRKIQILLSETTQSLISQQEMETKNKNNNNNNKSLLSNSSDLVTPPIQKKQCVTRNVDNSCDVSYFDCDDNINTYYDYHHDGSCVYPTQATAEFVAAADFHNDSPPISKNDDEKDNWLQFFSETHEEQLQSYQLFLQTKKDLYLQKEIHSLQQLQQKYDLQIQVALTSFLEKEKNHFSQKMKQQQQQQQDQVTPRHTTHNNNHTTTTTALERQVKEWKRKLYERHCNLKVILQLRQNYRMKLQCHKSAQSMVRSIQKMDRYNSSSNHTTTFIRDQIQTLEQHLLQTLHIPLSSFTVQEQQPQGKHENVEEVESNATIRYKLRRDMVTCHLETQLHIQFFDGGFLLSTNHRKDNNYSTISRQQHPSKDKKEEDEKDTTYFYPWSWYISYHLLYTFLCGELSSSFVYSYSHILPSRLIQYIQQGSGGMMNGIFLKCSIYDYRSIHDSSSVHVHGTTSTGSLKSSTVTTAASSSSILCSSSLSSSMTMPSTSINSYSKHTCHSTSYSVRVQTLFQQMKYTCQKQRDTSPTPYKKYSFLIKCYPIISYHNLDVRNHHRLETRTILASSSTCQPPPPPSSLSSQGILPITTPTVSKNNINNNHNATSLDPTFHNKNRSNDMTHHQIRREQLYLLAMYPVWKVESSNTRPRDSVLLLASSSVVSPEDEEDWHEPGSQLILDPNPYRDESMITPHVGKNGILPCMSDGQWIGILSSEMASSSGRQLSSFLSPRHIRHFGGGGGGGV